jgi:hypothetical protein
MRFDFLFFLGCAGTLLGGIALVRPRDYIEFWRRNLWRGSIGQPISPLYQWYVRFQGLGMLLIGILALAVRP